MRALAAATALLLLVAACASPAPTAPLGATASLSATLVPSAASTAPVVRVPSAKVQFDGWTADCSTVQSGDCGGVARLFVNNLAWNGKAVLDASGGSIAVEARAACPSSMPDWADIASCWQASAAGPTGEVCMVIARQSDPARAGSEFGQVGGDDMTDRAGGPPAGWPACD